MYGKASEQLLIYSHAHVAAIHVVFFNVGAEWLSWMGGLAEPIK